MSLENKLQKGCFITFEGGEGAGKTTLIEEIKKNLTARGYPVLSIREPGGTSLSEDIRKILLEKKEKNSFFSARAELALFLASRAQHVEEVILPALSQNKVILCDRFNDSTIAYQGFARGLGLDEVEQLCLFMSKNLVPDLTIYLDLDPVEGRRRQNIGKKTLDRLDSEDLSFHQKVRQGYLKIAERNPDRFLIVDASQSQEKVLLDSLKLIHELFMELVG